MALTLVIGNKNYSSWSLRPWLVMAHAGLDFDEVRIALNRPDSKANILAYSPNGKVPCLIDSSVAVEGGALAVWDSLAICEYVNEKYLGGRYWPRDEGLRAQARAVVAEMHSGFAPLRTHMSMDIRSRYLDKGRAAMAREDVAADVARIKAIWTEALDATGGPFLFGNFSIADSFFAPVATRFATYGVTLPAPLQAWSDRLFALQAMQRWIEAGKAEKEVLSVD
jgi:glutathione S-transferase